MPIRTCIACGAKREKRDLIRLVLDKRRSVVRDDRCREPGRGAYVCPALSCWERLGRGRRLERAFKTTAVVFDLNDRDHESGSFQGYLDAQ